MNKSSDVFAVYNLFEVANDVHVEDIDWQIVLLAHCGCREVHNLQALVVDFIVGDVVELGSRRVFFWVGCLNAVSASSLQHHVCLNLDAAKR